MEYPDHYGKCGSLCNIILKTQALKYARHVSFLKILYGMHIVKYVIEFVYMSYYTFGHNISNRVACY